MRIVRLCVSALPASRRGTVVGLTPAFFASFL